ncbi:4Fe-4S dicluster domain-containing protein [Enhygromyxa salina]|uniref:4Fe-4S dicluster domain-containing protein n=1 Tax=Enhygromyxa salina TaxID=215803 RepID=UPI0015E5FD38|nr:4Fe-4S dicluster domain-containing protein [Enhygromyxa salina]
MNYGFVIDNSRCIGCHACSTACKSENEVPLGVNRTWVKYVEHGAFPDVTRSFQVTRCNHCENPPCVRICPVTAMYQRDDGIVEFDKDVCIGCKACMQACPYDAIHIDPNTHTAAKCHYCAHRVDLGLEPACAVVCPTEAIVAGDLDDPMSKIAKLVGRSRTSVRKPEQGTSPKVLYIEGDALALHPTVLAERPRQLAFTQVVTRQGSTPAPAAPKSPAKTAASGARLRAPQAQGLPSTTIRSGGRMAEQMVQLGYNAQHEIPWHWQVPAYLVTKGIAAGIFAFLAIGWNLGLFAFDLGAMIWAGLLAVLATLATTGLLVADLERPERFLSILLRPQWRSWLTRGAFLLVGFAGVSGAWWAVEAAAAWTGAFEVSALARAALGWATAPLAIGAAVYTAFLFAQAEGRDLWQSPLLPIHLLIQATMMGTGALLCVAAFVELDPGLVAAARVTLGVSLAVDLFAILVGELGIPHATELAARAAHEIHRGRYAAGFWWGAIVLGHLVPLALLLAPAWGPAPVAGGGWLGALAAACATVGLYIYEYAFVMAPQELPNS